MSKKEMVIRENVYPPRETHILKIAARCNSDRNTVEIKVRGAFSPHEPDRRPFRAVEGTPSLTTASKSVGLANITVGMDVTVVSSAQRSVLTPHGDQGELQQPPMGLDVAAG